MYRKPLTNILIKPAGPDCNIACRYCFYLETSQLFAQTAIHRMPDEVLAATVRQLLAQAGGQVSFSWQGGEPTLMGLPFFKRAVAYEMQFGRGQTVSNALQTNGILLDPAWAAFLAQYHFLVGLSLDGPEHVHNKYRQNLGGQGTWHKVNKAAGMLLDAGVAVNALSVVTSYSVGYPREIYSYLKETGLAYMQFIPCCERDPASPSEMSDASVPADAYGEFLCTLFDLWLADFVDGKPTTSIRFFESLLGAYAGFRPNDCTLLDACGTYLVVEHTGDIYSCDFFVKPEWQLGNVMTGDLEEMLNSRRQWEFGQLKTRLPTECLNCEWLQYCRGSCPKDRNRQGNEPGISYFCASFKSFFEHADGTLKQLVDEWRLSPGKT